MNPAEKALLDYLNIQYPATISNIGLKEKIHNIWVEGLNNAIDICHKYRDYDPTRDSGGIIEEIRDLRDKYE